MPNVRCDNCGKCFDSARSNKLNIYCCDDCGKNFIKSGMTLKELKFIGISQSRAIKLGLKETGNVICSQCGKQIRYHNKPPKKIYCCDECAIIFIQQKMSLPNLELIGVSSARAYKLGWKKVNQIFCPVCHRAFIPRHPNQPNCHKDDCPSSDASYKITKTYEKTGDPACKIVVCDPMNKYRDVLLEKFSNIITIDEFNTIRKQIMKSNCKTFINPRCVCAAIFYIAIIVLKRQMPHYGQDAIAGAVNTNSGTLRNYVKKFTNEEKLKAIMDNKKDVKEKKLKAYKDEQTKELEEAEKYWSGRENKLKELFDGKIHTKKNYTESKKII